MKTTITMLKFSYYIDRGNDGFHLSTFAMSELDAEKKIKRLFKNVNGIKLQSVEEIPVTKDIKIGSRRK